MRECLTPARMIFNNLAGTMTKLYSMANQQTNLSPTTEGGGGGNTVFNITSSK